MRRLFVIPLLLLPICAQAADSTSFSRNDLACLSDEPTGCHPDYTRTLSYTFENRIPEMGWVQIELTMPDISASSQSEIILNASDGTPLQRWTHDGKTLDMFQVWAPVHAGQYLTFSGKYEQISKSIFHPCRKLR